MKENVTPSDREWRAGNNCKHGHTPGVAASLGSWLARSAVGSHPNILRVRISEGGVWEFVLNKCSR